MLVSGAVHAPASSGTLLPATSTITSPLLSLASPASVIDTTVTSGAAASGCTSIVKSAVSMLGTAAESATCTVNVKSPTVVASPEISPLPASSASPSGSEPAMIDQVYGLMPPVAASVCEYAMPAVVPDYVPAAGSTVTPASPSPTS